MPLVKVTVKVKGLNGLDIMRVVSNKLEEVGRRDLAEIFLTEATKHDFKHLINTAKKYVTLVMS